MDVPEFMDLFLKELELNSDLHRYYKLTTSDSRFYFRRAYIEQRLQYIRKHTPENPCFIWDAGCGYASASIFLTLNGHKVYGSTLEYYYEDIQKRLDYWAQYGDLKSLTIRYENLYDIEQTPDRFDVILLQDTLHHLEPVDTAVRIFHRMLKSGGKLVVAEENGNNIFIVLRNFFHRGFRKTIEFYDERLGRSILLGNENARGTGAWFNILKKGGFEGKREDVEYIRLFPPWLIRERNHQKAIQKEKQIAIKNKRIRELLYFGINFTMIKTNPELKHSG